VTDSPRQIVTTAWETEWALWAWRDAVREGRGYQIVRMTGDLSGGYTETLAVGSSVEAEAQMKIIRRERAAEAVLKALNLPAA